MGISALLRRALTWMKADERFARTRLAVDWTPTSSPTEIVARGSFWACVLLGLIVGVSAFDASYATSTPLPISLLPYLTHAVGAILLLMAGTLIARFLARSVLIGAVNAQLQYARFLSLGVKWLVLVLTAAMVLDHLEIGGAIVATGVRNSVWRNRADAGAGCRARFARHREPVAGESCRAGRSREYYADRAHERAGGDGPAFLKQWSVVSGQ